MRNTSITQDQLLDLFDYSIITGKFYNRITDRRRHAGGIAGSIKVTNKGYKFRRITVDNIAYQSSHLAWCYVYGNIPAQTDHINGDSLHNAIHNIREASTTENNQNKSRFKNNKSGLMGVLYYESRSSWKVGIGINGSTAFLGWHKDFFEACCARKAAEYKNGYHINHGR